MKGRDRRKRAKAKREALAAMSTKASGPAHSREVVILLAASPAGPECDRTPGGRH